MNIEKNRYIVQQFEKLCEREGMNAADVLLWLMDSIVGADRLPVTLETLSDWRIYHEAKAEYDVNPMTFTHEEVKKMLEEATDDVVDEEVLFFSPRNIERLKRAAAALDAGEGVEHDIIEVDDDTECSDEKWLSKEEAAGEDGEFVVKKIAESRKTIKELFEGFEGEYKEKEIDWGKSDG